LMTSVTADTSWTLLPAVVVFLAFALIVVYMVSPRMKKRQRLSASNEFTMQDVKVMCITASCMLLLLTHTLLPSCTNTG
jgi:hypothetical protein